MVKCIRKINRLFLDVSDAEDARSILGSWTISDIYIWSGKCNLNLDSISVCNKIIIVHVWLTVIVAIGINKYQATTNLQANSKYDTHENVMTNFICNKTWHDMSLWLWHTLQLIFSRLLFQYYHFGTKAQAQAQPNSPNPSQAWNISSLSPLKPENSPAHH